MELKKGDTLSLPKGYKKTELGIIPDDWIIVELGSFSKVFSGGTPNRGVPHYWNGNIPWITTTLIDFNTIPNAKEFITEEGLNNSSAKLCRKGDLLMAMYGQGKTRGKVAVLGIDATINQACAAISINNTVAKDYIFNNLIGRYDEIRKLSNTGNQENLSGSLIKKILVPLPPTTIEQKAIAQVLSDTDTLIQTLDKKIAKKKLIKKGVMQKLLTPKEGWEVKMLGEVATLKARIGWQGLTTAEYLNSGNYILITGTDFKNGFIDWDNCFYVAHERYKQDRNIQIKKGDILVTKDGTIGKVAFIKHEHMPATLNSGVFVIRPIEQSFYPEYFYYILMSNHFNEYLNQLVAGSTITHLYQKDFVNYKFPVPPTIEEQKGIAQVLSDIDKEIEQLEQKLNKYKQAKQGLMQQLLTGKIRLV
ncbi:MAG: restriction endonuclease subunit S [Carboxylicivirga sp.]|jgi:type I restriction enzyme S subunit|nr:restriction endonuclease subunit S [Carboxylicivirga sp.]